MARAVDERGRFDLVSAGGDLSGRLVEERRVQPIDLARVYDERYIFAPLRSLTSAGGRHYGIATLWGANLLLYRPDKVTAPRSWAAMYDQRYTGRITVPDNPLQLADTALYLGFTDPYHLTHAELGRATALLKRQRPLVSTYWDYASDEAGAFEDGRVWLGPGWEWQAQQLADKHVELRAVLPREGATGWVDSWMLAAGAQHPKCAYAWLRWITRPSVQAQLAVDFGGSPASGRACGHMNAIVRGSCHFAHADSSAFVRSIHFWQTPGAGCARCANEDDWRRAWAAVRS
jgi:putative spermidine/putrescine transport system substrate-binding protein